MCDTQRCYVRTSLKCYHTVHGACAKAYCVITRYACSILLLSHEIKHLWRYTVPSHMHHLVSCVYVCVRVCVCTT